MFVVAFVLRLSNLLITLRNKQYYMEHKLPSPVSRISGECDINFKCPHQSDSFRNIKFFDFLHNISCILAKKTSFKQSLRCHFSTFPFFVSCFSFWGGKHGKIFINILWNLQHPISKERGKIYECRAKGKYFSFHSIAIMCIHKWHKNR